jgi:hypothetical protein
MQRYINGVLRYYKMETNQIMEAAPEAGERGLARRQFFP